MYECAYVPIGAPNSVTTCRRFFTAPASPRQRQYEAFRAYFVEGRSSAQVARAFGYTPGSFQVMCHHFRREQDPAFFVSTIRRICSRCWVVFGARTASVIECIISEQPEGNLCSQTSIDC